MSQQVAWIFFFFQAEDGIRDVAVTGVQTCALPIYGDFHAIGSAHNLLAALVDAHLFHGNELHLDPNQIAWPRALDMNDRALRHITLSLDSKKRSEEHTSELQSRLHLVCRLLLEKKKNSLHSLSIQT